MKKYIVIKTFQTDKKKLLINGDVIYGDIKKKYNSCGGYYEIVDIFLKSNREFMGKIFNKGLNEFLKEE